MFAIVYYVVHVENRLAATAEAVANGELPDASLEFCPATLTPMVVSRGPSDEGTMKKVTSSVEGFPVSRVGKRIGKKPPRKVAAVDRGMSSMSSGAPSE